jgi:cysteinyl-tRNA synthetase
MAIKIYNTLTRRKEEFKPLKKSNVGIYVCGPTVYDAPHIGHARSAYVFDVIRRYFKHRGYEVKFVRNVTDVDDKIINKAKEEFRGEDLNTAVKNVSDKYLKVYHDYMEKLGILEPDKEPKATEYIEKMKDFIKILIERKVAYESAGDVYFDVRKANGYGKLSNQSFEMLESGVRIAPGENKKDPLDFALWKSAKEDEPSWDSPWGNGRPGWHIECSVMSSDILGGEFDIHGGGIDLVFPHHENEVAQSEGAGKKFARYWIHNGLLTINKEKMAKSSGNFITIEDVLAKYSADVPKLLFLKTHYAHPVDFSWDKMEENREALKRIIHFLKQVEKREKGEESIVKYPDIKKRLDTVDFTKEIENFHSKFTEAMDDDFNTPIALACLFEIIRLCEGVLCYESYKKEKHLIFLVKAKHAIQKLGNILGLTFKEELLSIPIKDIESNISLREVLRKKKMFTEADKIRKELEEKGVILKDSKDGKTEWDYK